ncbi:MAG: metallophosphoesterase, partial [Comamonadaceae bacterium]|nr:metallophosphoesterase [Comamonadaceae bacterium]
DLAVVGDTGIDDPAAGPVLAGMARARTALIVGDLAYDPAREAEYCAFVRSKIPAGAQLLPGNHEGQDGDGAFSAYAACLPDLWSVSGSYAEGHWYADRGNMRLIGIAPNIALPSGTRTYARGTPEREQLKDWIDEAKAAGKWVVVSMHMPCLTVGSTAARPIPRSRTC